MPAVITIRNRAAPQLSCETQRRDFRAGGVSELNGAHAALEAGADDRVPESSFSRACAPAVEEAGF